METYKTFAKIYDEVMDSSTYEDWLMFTHRHIEHRVLDVLELACGTGILSVELANQGHKVTGIDLSKDMIELANERKLEGDENLVFEVGDMLDLKKKSEYDVVTCYSDSLCYMPDKTSVEKVFQEVSKSLKDEGVFLFDVHSIYQVEEGFSEYSYHYQTDDFAFLWESYPGEYEYSVEHALTFFISQGNDLFKRYDELHEERTYPVEDYQEMLANAGFTDVSVYADFTDEAPDEKSRRWFFVCRK